MKKYFTKYLLKEGLDDKGPYNLFLCSRDIQAGDEVQSKLGTLDGKVEHKFQLEEALKEDVWFKVIGEISPEAIWVKEGDEFDEDEISKSHNKREEIIPVLNLETYTYWGDRVKILSNKSDWEGCFECEYLDEAELNHNIGCVKGGRYNYHLNNLGYTLIKIFKIKCPTCKQFH